MGNRAGEMQTLLLVVEAGSFSEAARQLLATPSTVSKLVSRIEDRLGVRHLNLHGELNVDDDDTVSSGNLNRQVWFNADDIGHAKVERLVAHAKDSLPFLISLPRRCRLQDLPERSGAWLQRLIAAVDSLRHAGAAKMSFRAKSSTLRRPIPAVCS
jgi:hypothetical protein